MNLHCPYFTSVLVVEKRYIYVSIFFLLKICSYKCHSSPKRNHCLVCVAYYRLGTLEY